MTTQQIQTLREKLQNIPDDVLEKVAKILMPVVDTYEDQYIVDELKKWEKETKVYTAAEIRFKNMFDVGEFYPIHFYAGFKAAEKYHGIKK